MCFSLVLNKRTSMIQQMLFSHSIVFMEWSNGGSFTCSMKGSDGAEQKVFLGQSQKKEFAPKILELLQVCLEADTARTG